MNINAQSSKKELVDYLRDVHGLDLPGLTKAELIQKASEVDGIDYAALSNPGEGDKSAEEKDLAKQERVKIRIHSSEDDMGKDDVFVGVNAVGFLIKRDTDVEVPIGVYNVLNDAKRKLYKQNPDGSLEMREVHAYPFSIVA